MGWAPPWRWRRRRASSSVRGSRGHDRLRCPSPPIGPRRCPLSRSVTAGFFPPSMARRRSRGGEGRRGSQLQRKQPWQISRWRRRDQAPPAALLSLREADPVAPSSHVSPRGHPPSAATSSAEAREVRLSPSLGGYELGVAVPCSGWREVWRSPSPAAMSSAIYLSMKQCMDSGLWKEYSCITFLRIYSLRFKILVVVDFSLQL
jgi:hypothetical protein